MATKQHMQRIFFEKILPRIILILMSVLFLLPFYWMIITSIKSIEELQQIPPTLIPHSFHWENFVYAVNYIPFFKYMRNSLILAIVSVIGAVISNSLVSYSVARINWKTREKLFYLIVATMFLPFPVILVAVFDIYARFHMINTFWPLLLPAFMGSATHIFMMRQYLLSIPLEISDAGYIDGANEWQIFIRLILPIMKPVIAVVAIFTALASWSDFLGPLLYLQREDLYPLSIGLQFFRSEHRVEYSQLMAASTLVTLPVVVIFICFQRFFVEGITIGAVKG
ncbi:sugar ABC transporter permease [Spirochaetia bacterium]|nr:sugar ABC transporter permease [Spirochaetia bacterium]